MKKNRLSNLALLLAVVVFAQDSRAQNGVEQADAFERLAASTTTICDRTPQVRDAIVGMLRRQDPSLSTCAEVTETQLATGITSLFLNGQSITTLKADDFAGLTSLTELSLYDNQLTTLPAGLFDGLTALTTLYLNGNRLSSLPNGLFAGLSSLATLYLYGNSVDPLPLTVSLEQVGTDQVKAVAPIGAPFAIVLPLSITNGSLSSGATTLTIPAGSVESASLTVVRTPGTSAAVTVNIGTLPRPPTNHVGYALAKASDLPLEVIDALLANAAPVFTDGVFTTRTIAENTAAGVNIGIAIAATDADNDALTYTLGGTDAAAFNMESTTGQLQTKTALDYETKSIYTVTVSVSDGRLTDTITVTITVTDLEEVEEGGDQQPEPDEPGDSNARTAFESSTPAGYTEVTLSKTGRVWGVPTKFTEDSNEGMLAFMVLGKLKGCSFANAEAARPSKVYIKIQDLGRQGGYVSAVVCGTTTRRYDRWAGARITHLRFFDESSTPNIQEAVYNAATGRIEIPGFTPPGPGPFNHDPDKDFNTLDAARNEYATGLWSDGNTMWVADDRDHKIYAYNLVTKARDPNKDFNTLRAAGNDDPQGLWSDGNTMWVANDRTRTDKIYAYNLATKAREPDKDFNTLDAAGNDGPTGLWSDGNTMWVADWRKIYAYNLATKAREPDKDFNTLDAAGNDYPKGLWSDGNTMWVADDRTDKIYAYNLATKAREPDKDFNTLDATGNNRPYGLWSGGNTMWVVEGGDDRIYAYAMPATSAKPDLEVQSPAVSNSTPTAGASFTFSATVHNQGNAQSPGTTLQFYRSSDATISTSDTEVGSHPVSGLAASGSSDYSIDLIAPSGLGAHYYGACVESVSEEYITGNNCSAGVVVLLGREPDKDFNTLAAAGNDRAHGLWSDGNTMWVVDDHDHKIYAYNMTTKARDPDKDFNRLGSDEPQRGLWSDGNTMWVALDYWSSTLWIIYDSGHLYAYSMTTKARDSDKDFSYLRGDRPSGLWSDGNTMWVADSYDDIIYAYNLATKAREPDKDFNALRAAGNYYPTGLWSDGNTMWVADGDGKIYAYNLATKAREPDKDFNALSTTGNDFPTGLWSDGNTMWVADGYDGKIYAYTMPTQAHSAAKAQALIGRPEETQLQQNAPNPFNSETVISYFLLEPGTARLEVFSVIGQRVAVLRQGYQQAGYHQLHWNGRDDAGRPLASGVYLYRLMTSEGILTRKLTLLR